MAADDAAKWDQRYHDNAGGQPPAARVLADHSYLLPRSGRALDLACGRGGNALLLAASGLETHAWDISRVALDQLAEHARTAGIGITTRQCDLALERPAEASFDVIVVSRFLDRALLPCLVSALTQGGLLFYQTFITDKIEGIGPSNPDYLLEPNELLHMFSNLHILLYREEGLTGDTRQGLRNEAMLIGLKS